MGQANGTGYVYKVVHSRAEDFLTRFPFAGDELVFVDPPYYPSTRRRKRVYLHDYTEQEHEQLLTLLLTLPCMVIVSGYANPLYAEMLGSWHQRHFQAKTHGGVRTETLWLNYEPSAALHDTRFLGANFREREVARRRLEQLQNRLRCMEPTERAAITQWLHQTYPEASRSQS